MANQNILQERLPGIVGGTIGGMALPLAVPVGVATFAACTAGDGGGDTIICYDSGGWNGCSPCAPITKPTTWGALIGSFAGSLGYGVKAAYDAYKAAGHVLDTSAIGPTFKGWGIGGAVGAAGAVAAVGTVETINHVYQTHRRNGEQTRQNNPAHRIEEGNYHLDNMPQQPQRAQVLENPSR